MSVDRIRRAHAVSSAVDEACLAGAFGEGGACLAGAFGGGGPADEYPVAARRIVRALRPVRSGDGDLRNRRSDARRTSLVEPRLEGLASCFDQRRGILEKRDAELMRTGRHGDSNFQIPVDERVVAVGRSLDSELSDRRPVEQQLDLDGAAASFNPSMSPE